MPKADLHLHSDYSDGSDSVEQLAKNISQAGINIFALTDHDEISGCVEMFKYVPDGVTFIPGIELTCKASGVKCHILGFNCDVNNETLSALIKKGKVLRRNKLEKRIKYLKEVHNIIFSEEEKEWLFTRKSPVKTHLAKILVKRGLADDNISAMRKYLDGCPDSNLKFDAKEAIDAIISAGAIPVWAHPLGGEGETHTAPDLFFSQLNTLKDCGIQGLEGYYSRYNDEEINFLVKVAKEQNLLISGGSDYHGLNKNIPLAKLNVNSRYVDSAQFSVLEKILK